MMSRVVGVPLESDFLRDNKCPEADGFPCCDAIVVMGGGVGGNTNEFSRAFLHSGADRIYFAALLWKAGKAPVIIPSGSGANLGDRMFLQDLGVPDNAILVEDKAQNTEQNAIYVRRIMEQLRHSCRSCSETNKVCSHLTESSALSSPKILLVTSAWHMKRTLLMFQKYAADICIVPAACDFECTPVKPWQASELFPNSESFWRNSNFLHEWIGYLGYRWFR